MLQAKHSGWRLVAYGHYMDQRGAEPWMRQNGLGHLIDNGSVELRGYGSPKCIREMLYEEADVFCSPSLEESFGMVFIEAMAQGVPCVGGENSGAVPWVLGDGGAVCDVTNPERLAQCIERLMLDYSMRKKLSENAVKNVRERFLMDSVVNRYIALLEYVIEQGRHK
jgi:glycosyltransferase involved in cell wall biosynthesis